MIDCFHSLPFTITKGNILCDLTDSVTAQIMTVVIKAASFMFALFNVIMFWHPADMMLGSFNCSCFYILLIRLLKCDILQQQQRPFNGL